MTKFADTCMLNIPIFVIQRPPNGISISISRRVMLVDRILKITCSFI